MSADGGLDVARAGLWLKRRVRVAFVLSSVVPLLVVLVVVLPTLQSGILQVLVVLTIVGMLAGAWVIWDLGRLIGRMGALTVEQQAAEINTFASRLDAAFKEVESTNARLKVRDSTVNAFAQILMQSAPSISDVMARYDSSRFAVLLVGAPRESALRFVERVRIAVAAENPRAEGTRLRVGIASLPEDGAGAERLISAAEAVFRRGLPAD
jgi:diguanylate cyclase (GGDEF)-like protein